MNKVNTTSFFRKYQTAIVVTTVLVVGFLVVHLIVGQLLTDLRITLESQIEEQETLLTDIAMTTARGGADKVTETIIKDCSIVEREEFDQLLGRLDKSLSVRELTALERLFARCGSFYSERKSVMVARLSREVDVYELLVTQYKMLEGDGPAAMYAVEQWRELVLEEERQSVAFARLVGLQGQIIDKLLSGSGPKSDEVQAVLLEVQEQQQALTVASNQAGKIRESLTAK
jgi:hypothetical protein